MRTDPQTQPSSHDLLAYKRALIGRMAAESKSAEWAEYRGPKIIGWDAAIDLF